MSYELLKSLAPVKPGDDILTVVTAARINAIQSVLLAIWEGKNLSGGEGIVLSRGSTVSISASLEDVLAGMTGAAVCNEDGTITITLTPTPPVT